MRELRETMVFSEIERIHDLRAILDRSQLVTEAANQNKAELDRIVK